MGVMDEWKSVQIRVENTPAAEDWITELAQQLGACGACGGATAGEWILYFRSADYENDLPQRIAALADAAGFTLTNKSAVDTVVKQNWNEAWREFYHPVQVTPRIQVLPSWMSDQAGCAEISLLIEPGMAFGTGTHETTQLCMKLMEKHLLQGDVVLDAGTGTGILLIAALKLGARIGIGFDLDPDIRENAAFNLKLNEIGGDRAIVYLGGTAPLRDNRFDLIICNMLSTQFLPILPELINLCALYGKLVLSGLLIGEEPEVRAAVSDLGLKVVDAAGQGEWAALVTAR